MDNTPDYWRIDISDNGRLWIDEVLKSVDKSGLNWESVKIMADLIYKRGVHDGRNTVKSCADISNFVCDKPNNCS